MATRTLRKLLWVFFLALLAMGAIACATKGPKMAMLKPGPMPEGATWRGVYYSQVYGNLHLIEEGDEIQGKWRTVAGDSWGELHGKADGNVLRYEWVEHRIGLVGPSSVRSGHGYFKYVVKATVDSPKEPDEIVGEWGLGADEAGNSWKAIKQVNMEPNPNSVMPDEVESRPGTSGGWDESPAKQESEEGSSSDSSDSGE